MTPTKNESKYLLLAESKVRTAMQVMDWVFSLPFMAQARSARAMKTRKEKTKIHNLPYEANKTFSIWLC